MHPRDATHPLEATTVTPYLAFLFALLSTATLFEGFDAGILSFAAPESRASLDIDLDQWGRINSLVRVGAMASFLFLLYADRWGRRSMMMFTIVGFAVANGLTAFVTDKYMFTACQFFSRLFLTAEYSLAVIMAGEEFPARYRGRAVALLTALAPVGVMVMSKGVQPYVLLTEGAEGNWLHSLGTWMVSHGQSAAGLAVDGANWRALYVLGAFPLVAVFALRLGMRETRRFEAARAGRPAPRLSLRELGRAAALPWRAEYRRQTAIVTLLWNCVYVVTGPSVVYYVIFAREDLGLTPAQVGDVVFWGYAGGVLGHFAAARLIERIGRKKTSAGFYIAAAVSIFLLYHHVTMLGQYLWMFATVFCFGAGITATHVYASELFPTEIRATGYGWTSNMFGRITEVATPAVMGFLIAELGGIPASIGVVAAGPIVGALLVLRYAPETRGLTLEEIQAQLRPELGDDGAAEPAPYGGGAATSSGDGAPR